MKPKADGKHIAGHGLSAVFLLIVPLCFPLVTPSSHWAFKVIIVLCSSAHASFRGTIFLLLGF